MTKITIITHAFNPGGYIYPCVDSVLNQTFRDFKYVIVDNASSDGTKEVLEAYAEKDDRICLYRNEDNSGTTIPSIEKYVDTEYFMILDHDDYLEPDALECLYEAAIKNDLDMVFGRCEMVDEEGIHLDDAGMNRTIEEMNGDGLIQYFPALYWQMRTVWGKLIRREMVEYIDMDTYRKNEIARYGGDTVIILSMAFAAKRMGTVEKILHHYRILDKSESRSYSRHRFVSDRTLLEMGRKLLESKDGLTSVNELFLYRVYCSAILDTLRMIIRCECPNEEKCDMLSEVITNNHTYEMKEMLRVISAPELTEFQKKMGEAIFFACTQKNVAIKAKTLLLEWLYWIYGKEILSIEEFNRLFGEKKAVLFLLCLGREGEAYKEMSPEQSLQAGAMLYLEIALKQEKSIKDMAHVLHVLGAERPEVFKRAENALLILCEQNSLLSKREKEIWLENPDITVAVCAEDYLAAANLCLERLEQEKWQRSGGILDLAITLTAILEEADVFVMLKKCSCEFLIREGKPEEARVVLSDLKEMCPEDGEVQGLQKMLL